MACWVRTALGPEPGSPPTPAPAAGRALPPASPSWVAVVGCAPGSMGQAGAEVPCVGGGGCGKVPAPPQSIVGLGLGVLWIAMLSALSWL